jgi:hypothetical protein
LIPREESIAPDTAIYFARNEVRAARGSIDHRAGELSLQWRRLYGNIEADRGNRGDVRHR